MREKKGKGIYRKQKMQEQKRVFKKVVDNFQERKDEDGEWNIMRKKEIFK